MKLHHNAPRTFRIGGRSFDVSRLTLRDRAHLDAYLVERLPNPASEAEQYDFPPEITSVEGLTVFVGEDEGRAVFLRRCLLRHHPDVTHEDALAMQDDADMVAILRFALEIEDFETDPRVRLLYQTRHPNDPGRKLDAVRTVDWGMLMRRAVQELHWTHDQVLDHTPVQVAHHLADAKQQAKLDRVCQNAAASP